MSLAQRIPVDFPLAGSFAWLKPAEGRPEALQVRIVQHDVRDGSVRVSAIQRPPFGQEASAFRRVDRAELYASEVEAIGEICKPCRGSGQRKRSRKGAVKVTTCATCHGAGRVFP